MVTPDVLNDIRHKIVSLQLDVKLLRLGRALKFRPDQPRVPAGNPEGGRWTHEGGAVQSVQFRPGNSAGAGQRRRVGPWDDATPAQQTRLAVSNMRAEEATRRVQVYDPAWRPEPTIHEGIEGAIAANQADLNAAEARYRELQRVGGAPGIFADESLPARNPGREFTTEERGETNRIGSETGCHTCGQFGPLSQRGNFVVDHQPPTAMNWSGAEQRLYPQCVTCSARQGAWITNFLLRNR
jgi:hypothetical protein